jgi:hypothetical protein
VWQSCLVTLEPLLESTHVCRENYLHIVMCAVATGPRCQFTCPRVQHPSECVWPPLVSVYQCRMPMKIAVAISSMRFAQPCDVHTQSVHAGAICHDGTVSSHTLVSQITNHTQHQVSLWLRGAPTVGVGWGVGGPWLPSYPAGAGALEVRPALGFWQVRMASSARKGGAMPWTELSSTSTPLNPDKATSTVDLESIIRRWGG